MVVAQYKKEPQIQKFVRAWLMSLRCEATIRRIIWLNTSTREARLEGNDARVPRPRRTYFSLDGRRAIAGADIRPYASVTDSLIGASWSKGAAMDHSPTT